MGASPRDQVQAVALSPDGRSMASAAWDATIRFYDVDTGQPVGDGAPVGSGAISQLSYTADGKMLVATDGQHTYLLDATSRTPVGAAIRGRGVAGPNEAVALLSTTGKLRVWRHDPSRCSRRRVLAPTATSRAGNGNASWVPSRPYHRTCPDVPEG